MSILRRLLDEVADARPGTSLDEIARRLDVTRDEVDSMVDFWVSRGRLALQAVGGCTATDCGSCGHRTQGQPTCGAAGPRSGPRLVTLRLLDVPRRGRTSG